MTTTKKIKTYYVIGTDAFKGFNFRFTKIGNVKYFLIQDVRKVYSTTVLDLLDTPPLRERVTYGSNSQFRQLVNVTMLRNALNKLARSLENEIASESLAEDVKPKAKAEKPKAQRAESIEAFPKPEQTKQDHVTALTDIVDKCVRTSIGPVVKIQHKEKTKKSQERNYGVPRTNLPEMDIEGLEASRYRGSINSCLKEYAKALCKLQGREKDADYLTTISRKVYLSCYAEFDVTLSDMLEKEGKTLKSVGLGKLEIGEANKDAPYLKRVEEAGYTPLMLQIALRHYNAAGL
jgi:hypothetical protein